jgi:hypothetical protein
MLKTYPVELMTSTTKVQGKCKFKTIRAFPTPGPRFILLQMTWRIHLYYGTLRLPPTACQYVAFSEIFIRDFYIIAIPRLAAARCAQE